MVPFMSRKVSCTCFWWIQFSHTPLASFHKVFPCLDEAALLPCFTEESMEGARPKKDTCRKTVFSFLLCCKTLIADLKFICNNSPQMAICKWITISKLNYRHEKAFSEKDSWRNFRTPNCSSFYTPSTLHSIAEFPSLGTVLMSITPLTLLI